MVNLIKNAVEAGRTVLVTVGARDGEARIEVTDDGPGLSPEARAHLFEPFFTTKPNGTGLGLPTSRRFVEAHGGAIDVGTSELGGRSVPRAAAARARLRSRAPTIPDEARAT